MQQWPVVLGDGGITMQLMQLGIFLCSHGRNRSLRLHLYAETGQVH
jgi:hypothetical protein